MRKHFTYKNLVSQINLNRKGELRWERKREKYREREKIRIIGQGNHLLSRTKREVINIHT